MVCTSGELLCLEIGSINQNAFGISRFNGQVIFVPGALPGELVEVRITQVKKNYAHSEIIRIIKPSPERILPACPFYSACGGCVWQQVEYAAELRYKRDQVAQTLQRIGGITAEVGQVNAGTPFAYRNRAVLHVKNGHIGFFNRKTHQLCAVDRCLLLRPELNELLALVRQKLNTDDLRSLRALALRCSSDGKHWLLTLIAAQPDDIFKNAAERLCADEPRLISVWECTGPPVYGEYGEKWRLLAGKEYLPDTLGNLHLHLAPASFLQVNHKQALHLYRIIEQYALSDGNETVLDLYSGVGSIALFLARQGLRVIGVESYAPAAEDARRNAVLNAIDNCRFITGTSERVMPHLAACGKQFDVVVLDPPRAGCAPELIHNLCQQQPPHLIYVSCDPATLARDLKILSTCYRLVSVQPIDMFSRTAHVETVCLLSKLNAKQHIEVDIHMDELDLTDAEKKATYSEIKEYVLKQTGLKVSSLYIAQVKQKCGIIERENYNKSKSEDARQPQCTPDKEKAIKEALKHFAMI